jgi:hypothetical protein
MKSRVMDWPSLGVVVALAVATGLTGCGSKEKEAPPAASTAAPAAPPPAAAPAAPATDSSAAAGGAAAPLPAATEAATTQAWTPEALEELLAPIALYPDPVLSQVLIASTNPQEVLDAGNWLVANETLKGKALDDGAAKVGFTPPIRALIQFPQTIDMMCMELGWTTELGQAFVADQQGVLDAVQRLRKQAVDAGNLKSSDAMKVVEEEQEGEEVVVLKPPKPDVVYVPTYDPQTVYAPAPAATTAAAPAPAPAAAPAPTTTTTTTTTEEKGHSTGSLVATGLLAFGAGILVNEVFDDDDDYYYPHYGYGGMPYYPPYPYRPAYGGGYYPSSGYNRPPNWNGGIQNSGNIVINTGGNSYWDRYDNRPGRGGAGTRNRAAQSPISVAKPNRPELAQLNQRQPRPMPANVQRPSPNATAANWKGQSSYAGRSNRPAANRSTEDRIAQATPKYSSPARGGAASAQRPTPKVQGTYAGKDRPRPETRDVQKPARDVERPGPATRDVQPQRAQTRDATPQRANTPEVHRPGGGGGDRGYAAPDLQRPGSGAGAVSHASRPSPGIQSGGGGHRGTAMSGANRGGAADRAASQRGRQSMPQGARSKGGGRDRNR